MKQGPGHWLIDIERIPRKYRNPNYITENGNDSNPKKDSQSMYTKKDITKLHNHSHKSAQQLEVLLKASKTWDRKVKDIVEQVVNSCNTCKRFKRTPSSPKVAFPKAHGFNEVTSLDL